ncbi:glycolipid 2-alpha-mannosyltransferase [Hesseltinella vesiculosa]|uniref:Glycolipid 2-alpha-mannosyltransferase n=1 Tax=Hesseltinella vesiculosa TaxID=101127 RepID=A0A1X2GGX5_9FUNG|nr:glycolipid 2-alpha-mannosyltransferase [Hesseltinella vesiculosa]
MSKRRQTLALQILSVVAVIFMIGYVTIPHMSGGPPSLARPGTKIDYKNLTNPVTTPKEVTNKDFMSGSGPGNANMVTKKPKVKAAFVMLARNSNLDGARSSIQQMEDRFNRNFNYPYIFLNDEEFTDEFKEMTSSMTKAQTFYGVVPREHWSYPDHIDTEKAAETRRTMEEKGIIYGGSESYRHMCRYQSGFFFRHPLLDGYEYYWRVEPDISYFCDVDYDVFQMMKDNDYKYGWTVSLTEYMETIPTLWKTTRDFFQQNPQYLAPKGESVEPWLTDNNFETYNGCHFWSNFEIGSLEFLRSEAYMKYFEHLDRAGGFFYERWGDAPVHSLAVAHMLPSDQIHFFNDIGYLHNPLTHCPTEKYLRAKCHCNSAVNFDWDAWSCANRYKRLVPDFVWNEKTYNEKTDPYRISKK